MFKIKKDELINHYHCKQCGNVIPIIVKDCWDNDVIESKICKTCILSMGYDKISSDKYRCNKK